MGTVIILSVLACVAIPWLCIVFAPLILLLSIPAGITLAFWQLSKKNSRIGIKSLVKKESSDLVDILFFDPSLSVMKIKGLNMKESIQRADEESWFYSDEKETATSAATN